MRAGTLDRIITIERSTIIVDDYGTPAQAWAVVATVRARRIQSSTEEFMRAYGSTADSVVVFRIRHLDGITTADRVTEGAAAYDLKEIKELGRRAGLELRCTASGG